MAAPPLSHHEILGLVEPFSRRGRQVDLAASDRLERRLVFRRAADAPPAPAETLQLENPSPGTWRLLRTLQLPGGLQAALHTDGPDPGELLARIESVDPASQWRSAAGFELALVQRLVLLPDSAGPQLQLQRAVLQAGGLTLKLRVPTARGTPAEVDLQAGGSGPVPQLPEDLLAVLGWNFTRLRPEGGRWSTKLRLRHQEPQRSRWIELQLERTAAHLARTLAEPPARYHERWRLARWGAWFRRAIPLLTFFALAGAAVALPALGFDQHSVARIMIFDGPLILLGLSLCLQEMARFEVPPWPRRLADTHWRAVAQPGAPG